eukprot:CAMPEP_0201950382 /NCGR_PEP_ID=MMETSP0903-20130614/56457_1 /ASSEMBLY_ACC=CAM_ASM_000552 /TAXON_ID=420261 /ORGANISM="Thalassiosira antarctica, Strain CCMP982" /LENGTH=724 /DNA_ID=CAMNT_0048493617 /DNA_START=656 /DNA_END=2830 /DNA_ORIENTATION=-
MENVPLRTPLSYSVAADTDDATTILHHDEPMELMPSHSMQATIPKQTQVRQSLHNILYSGTAFRDRLARSLSQSIMQHSLLLPLLDQQQQHQQQQRGLGENNWSMDGLSKAISLLGGHGSSSVVVSRQEPHQQYYPSKVETPIMSTSSTSVITKQPKKTRQKVRKRRKNNTGFYYGIQEDVWMKEGELSRDDVRQVIPPGRKAKLYTNGKDMDVSKKDYSTEEGKQTPSILPPQPEEDEPPTNKKRRQKSSPPPNQPQRKKSSDDIAQQPGMMSNIAEETLFELRGMRDEIIALREELRAVKDRLHQERQGEQGQTAKQLHRPGEEKKSSSKSLWGQGRQAKEDESSEDDMFEEKEEQEHQPFDKSEQEESSPEIPQKAVPKKLRASSKQRNQFERIGKDVEQWANNVLFEEDDKTADGWKEVACNKFAKKKFNRDGRTQVYVKWMPDTRDEKDIDQPMSTKPQTYPCLKCYTTIDAPLHHVCSFLANEETIGLYNELVVDHADVEELSPNAKITWTKCPKILFVKPRDFVTYCSHWWKGDGTQVLVNQACDHVDRPGVMLEGQGDCCRGFAIRGANFISKDPDDPNKTRITMLSHANPGGGLPQWAMTSVVNAVVQIEPFKFFHNINEGICNYYDQDTALSKSQLAQTSTVGNDGLPGRSKKPAGIAHLGFTCFWPNGGGLKEESNKPLVMNHPSPVEELDNTMWANSDNDDEDGAIMEELDD